MWLNKSLRMPTPDEALPGRAERMPMPERHFVNGAPLDGAVSAASSTAMFGMGCFWGAERKFWETDGRHQHRGRLCGGPHAEPDLSRGVQRLTGHNEVVRVVFDPEGRELRGAARASSGRTTTRPRACGRATTSARSTARRSTATATSQRRAAEASRDAYQQALGRRRPRRDHDRDRAGARVLLRRGLSPAVPGEEPGRLLRPRRHGRELSDGNRSDERCRADVVQVSSSPLCVLCASVVHSPLPGFPMRFVRVTWLRGSEDARIAGGRGAGAGQAAAPGAARVNGGSMRIANVRGRLTLLTPGGGVDVEKASAGRFAADPQAAFAHWAELRSWAREAGSHNATPIAEADLGSPSPRPTQVFGIGLNYRDHAAESGMPIPDRPATFTKFPTCITGPNADGRAAERGGRLGGRAGRRDRRARLSRCRGRRLEPRRRPRRRPGSLRARRAVGRRRAVLARQVVSGIRTDRPVPGDARRDRRPRRSRDRLQRQRRGDAEEPHLRHGFQRAATDRRAVGHPAAAAGRRDLHGHAGGHRRDAQAAACS